MISVGRNAQQFRHCPVMQIKISGGTATHSALRGTEMNKKVTVAKIQQTLMAFLGLCLLMPIFTATAADVPVVPCQFPFDASHKEQILIEQFRVKEHRNYQFMTTAGNEQAHWIYLLSAPWVH